jgi:hypothetical protein
MPIKGISDRVRLPRLGKIRLGIMVEDNRSSFPQPVDYFVCPEVVQELFGEKPRELPVMFPSEDEESWASQYYRCYSRSHGLVCKGDGETASALVDKYTGHLASKYSQRTELKQINCSPDRCAAYASGRCRRVMNLQFMLPDVPGLGIWQLDTSSYYSICNINAGIKLVKSLCGHIAMVSLLLRLIPQRTNPGGAGKTVHVLSLDMAGTITELMHSSQFRSDGIVLPDADEEAPDDLFPEEVLEEADDLQVGVEATSLTSRNRSISTITGNKGNRNKSLSLSSEKRTSLQKEKEVALCGSGSVKDS